jgi:hypothetical protein
VVTRHDCKVVEANRGGSKEQETCPLLFGQISFELFGRFDGVVQDTEALFGHAVTVIADLVGMTPG